MKATTIPPHKQNRADRKQHVDETFVSVPRCSNCGDALQPASAWNWLCANEKCKQHGRVVDTGTYPWPETEIPVEYGAPTFGKMPLCSDVFAAHHKASERGDV